MKKIVIVGQTPPPYHGQAVMIEKILNGKYQDVQIFHVRMSFSKEIDEIGSFSIYKLVHLFKIIFKILYYRVAKNANVLYYPPAGPNRIPVIRDMIILISTRWLFSKTIFHFHAGGVSEMTLTSPLFRYFFRLAYFNVDCAILLSELNPADGKALNARKQVVIPYGIEDSAESHSIEKHTSATVTILFVALIKESKGILILLEACRQLKQKNLDFRIKVMGKFESNNFEHTVKNLIEKYEIEDKVTFLGVLSGEQKLLAFKSADIFCFPSFYESETFGVVLLEAMQFSLPVVATTWRGIPSIVAHGKSGLLVEPQNASELADKLEVLIIDSTLRQKMGEVGREIFLSKYTLKQFQDNMGQIFRLC